MSVSGKRSKEKFKGKGICWKKLTGVSSSEKSFDPKFRWERGLKKKGMKNIINNTNGMFNFAILLRRVGTREPEF